MLAARGRRARELGEPGRLEGDALRAVRRQAARVWAKAAAAGIMLAAASAVFLA